MSWEEAGEGHVAMGKRHGVIIQFEKGAAGHLLDLLEERFSQVMEQVLRERLDSLQAPSALLPRDISQVMKWGRGEVQPLREGCLHELFEERALAQPDAVALYDQEGRLHMTYGELDYKSYELASMLQGVGGKPEKLVGLLLDKSFGMVVGILGVLRSGCAYVPMDPSFPKERIKYMMKDSGMEYLVTHNKYVREFGGVVGSSVLCVDVFGNMVCCIKYKNHE